MIIEFIRVTLKAQLSRNLCVCCNVHIAPLKIFLPAYNLRPLFKHSSIISKLACCFIWIREIHGIKYDEEPRDVNVVKKGFCREKGFNKQISKVDAFIF